jgi:hypothetical protein
MLYDDFIKEFMRWQGIFDGYPENQESFKIYFEIINEKIKDLDMLMYCLRRHHDNRNKLLPKPFELLDCMPLIPEGMQKLKEEVDIIIEKVKKEQLEKRAKDENANKRL